MPRDHLTFAPKRRRRVFRLRTLVTLLVVVGLGAGAWFVLSGGSSTPGLPSSELDHFLTAWNRGDAATMASLIDLPPNDLATVATSLVKEAPPGTKAKYTRTGLTRTKQGAVVATYHARVDISGFGPFEWNGTFAFARLRVGKQNVWRVSWRPDALYPGLAPDQHLGFRRRWPARASILGADGSILAGTQGIVTIGLEPDRVAQTLPQIKTLLQQLTGTDPASIDTALHAPGIKPNYFVPVAVVPDDARYASVLRPQLAPIPGVFFQRSQGVPTPTGPGAQFVGRVGDITADLLKRLGAPYQVGDRVGLSGLQLGFETRLAGKPSGTVTIEQGTRTERTLKSFAGKPGQNVQLTLDARTQAAAEAALAGVTQPAALVAIDAPTGALRAIVSKPDNGFDRAISGGYPPGSTFKVITSTALLMNGVTGTTPAPCPPTLTIDGRTFKNFEGEANGAIDLADAFKISCNNAFIGLADKLPSDALRNTAALFGFNASWSLPIPSTGGSFPAPRDRAELAASAIGQGRVLASPMQMASVAAAVDVGQWHAPIIATQPTPKTPTVKSIDPGVLASLRAFMASVEQTGGTAAGAGLPAGVFGKTGTAEFGNANPPQTHAWFIGYRGTLAFAVIVEGGGVGGRVAAPLAAKFLNALG